MRFITDRRAQRRLIAAALGMSALFAAPAHASRLANPYDCAPNPTLTQAFAPWDDYALYTPVVNAGLEDGATGWTLTGAARVAAGNEPWKIGGDWHRNSLDLPEGSSATTAPLCIDETYPHFRLFVRNAGAAKAALRIEVLYLDDKGMVVATKATDYSYSAAVWKPTGTVGIDVFLSKPTVTAAPVAFRFTATGKGARFQLDDVYVDPRMAR